MILSDTHTHTHTHIHTHTHTFTHTYSHTHIFTHIHTHTHTHSLTFTHTHSYTFTHTHTLGRTPLDEGLACLITLNTHKTQTSVFPVGFEPTITADERPQTHALDRAATGIS
jgi:hypothetical protein